MELLSIYLDDHWAAAGAGAALAARLHRNNQDTTWAPELARILEEVESDEQVLSNVRKAIAAEGGRLKRTAARAAERVGRLKLNGSLLTYSPLSRLEEAEGLMAGVAAKQRLWAALRAGAGSLPELAGFDFAQLETRAEQQLRTLASFHEWAAAAAFGDNAD